MINHVIKSAVTMNVRMLKKMTKKRVQNQNNKLYDIFHKNCGSRLRTTPKRDLMRRILFLLSKKSSQNHLSFPFKSDILNKRNQ